MRTVTFAFHLAVFVIGTVVGGNVFSQKSPVVNEYRKIATDSNQVNAWLQKNESKILSFETAREAGGKEDSEAMIEILGKLGNEIDLDSQEKTKTFLSRVIRCHMVASRPIEIEKFIKKLPRETQNECLRAFKTDDRNAILNDVVEIYFGARRKVEPQLFNPGSEMELVAAEPSGSVRALVAKLRGIDEMFRFEHPTVGQYARLLAANSLEDVDFTQRGSIATDLVILTRNLPNTQSRRRAFDKGMELIEKKLEAGEWYKKYYEAGGSYSGQAFFRIISQSGQDWYEIALLTDLLWNDPPHEFSMSLIDIGIRRALVLEWEKAKTQSAEDQPGAKTLIQFLANFRDALPKDEQAWGDPIIFRPIFFEACGAMNDPIMTGNLVRQIESSASKDVLLHEFAIGARMWLSTTGDNPQNFADPTPWVTAMLKSLNADLTPAMRTFVGHRMLYEMEDACPLSLKLRFAEDLTATMNSDGPANGYYVGRVLRMFNHFERDEKWNQLADQLISGWEVKNQTHEGENSLWRDYNPLSHGTIGILELYFLRGDIEGARQFIDRFGSRIRSQAGALALLIREGEHATAAQWLEGELRASRFNTVERHGHPADFQIAFDEKLKEQLELFLLDLDSEQQLFTRLLVESLPNGPDHEKRIDDLASAVSDSGIQNESVPIEALNLLSRYAYASEKAVRVLEFYLTNTEIGTLFSNASGMKGTENAIRPAILLGIEKLRRENDPELLVDLIEKIETSLDEKDQPYGLYAFGEAFDHWLTSDLESLQANTKNLTLGVLSEFIGSVLNARFVNQSSTFIAHHSVVAALTKPSTLAEWEQGLNESEIAKLSNFRRMVGHANLYPLHEIFATDLKQREIARQAIQDISPRLPHWRLMED